MSAKSKSKSKPGRKSWKYLVFWIPKRGADGTKSVLNATEIPIKDRKEGTTTKIKCADSNGVKRNYDALIVKKGLCEIELYKIDLDKRTGEILGANQRAFSGEVMAKRLEFVREKRATNKVVRAGVDKVGNRLTKNPSIFSPPPNSKRVSEEDFGPPSKAKRLVLKETQQEQVQPHQSQVGTLQASSHNQEQLHISIVPPTSHPQGQIPHTEIHGGPKTVSAQPLLVSKSALGRNDSINQGQPSASSKSFSFDVVARHLDSVFASHGTWEILEFLDRIEESVRHLNKSEEHLDLNGVSSFLSSLVKRGRAVAQDLVNLKKIKPQYVKLPGHYFVNDPDKKELFPDIPFYVSDHLKSLIHFKCLHADPDDWKTFCAEVLNEIYGDNMKWLSCEGKRGTQGIHHYIRKGLLEYAGEKQPGTDIHDLADHINRLFGNKKTTWRRKLKEELSTSLLEEDQPTEQPVQEQSGGHNENETVDHRNLVNTSGCNTPLSDQLPTSGRGGGLVTSQAVHSFFVNQSLSRNQQSSNQDSSSHSDTHLIQDLSTSQHLSGNQGLCASNFSLGNGNDGNLHHAAKDFANHGSGGNLHLTSTGLNNFMSSAYATLHGESGGSFSDQSFHNVPQNVNNHAVY